MPAVLSWIKRCPRTSLVIAAAVFLDLCVGACLAGLVVARFAARGGAVAEAMDPTSSTGATPFDEPLRDGDLLIKVIQNGR